MKKVVSKCFRIRVGAKDFEYNLEGIGKFKGSQVDLLRDIDESGLNILNTKSWTEYGDYSVSYKHIVSNFNNNGVLSQIINKYKVG